MHRPKLLAFDVFGTVVDWHGTICRHVDALQWHTRSGQQVAGAELAARWRKGYQPAMQRVRSGELGWTRIDDLHRLILDEVLDQMQVADVDEAARRALNLVWHRLDPWPDVVGGLLKLKALAPIVTLSNGNMALLMNMARHAGLPWDAVISAELFKHYKPDPEVYLGVAQLFGLAPADVMLVAAHKDDLAGARACGLQTAYVLRRDEWGAEHPKETSPDPLANVNVGSLHDLAGWMQALPVSSAA